MCTSHKGNGTVFLSHIEPPRFAGKVVSLWEAENSGRGWEVPPGDMEESPSASLLQVDTFARSKMERK